MKRFLSIAAIAAITFTSASASAQSCNISSTSGSAVNCTVGTTFSMTMPSLMNLTLDGTSVTLAAPAAVTEFDGSGLVTKETTGPSFTVKSNRAYRVQVNANASTFTHTSITGAASYAKPAGDVSWKVGSGAYSTLTTTPTDIASGSATAVSASALVTYKAGYDITKDQPGAYSLGVTFTLVAP